MYLGKGRKHCGKRRKCWLPAFSPFPTVFSKGFLLKIFKSGLCGKGLSISQMMNFEIFEIERVCRRQFLILLKCWKVLRQARKCCSRGKNCLLQAIYAFLTVFYKTFVLQTCKKTGLFGEGLSPLTEHVSFTRFL